MTRKQRAVATARTKTEEDNEALFGQDSCLYTLVMHLPYQVVMSFT